MISELTPVTIDIHGGDTGVISLDLREKCHVDEAAFLVEAAGLSQLCTHGPRSEFESFDTGIRLAIKVYVVR
ncbi:hypothetical protein [Halorubrum saccharovorum]|uniref:hypothetical protein n=1 Tax=Halorubrum saccharovorum TaxID=2248 RepID=UPI0006797EBA|nr:hypothetical protein [Halorubrum saccharovorum]